jgi:hypothetical protein
MLPLTKIKMESTNLIHACIVMSIFIFKTYRKIFCHYLCQVGVLYQLQILPDKYRLDNHEM